MSNNGLNIGQLFIVAENAIEEIDILIDGRVDITETGGPNYAMRIQQELLYIKFVIAKLKEQEEKKNEGFGLK